MLDTKMVYYHNKFVLFLIDAFTPVLHICYVKTEFLCNVSVNAKPWLTLYLMKYTVLNILT